MVALFAVALLVGLAIGWVRGGTLATLGNVRLRLMWLAPVALLAEAYMMSRAGMSVPWWVLPVHLGAYTLLMVMVVANRSLAGMLVVGFGLMLNALVIGANGGLMPQAPETHYVKHAGQTILTGQRVPRSKDVSLPREQTRLWWLSDILVTPRGLPVQAVLSLGDLVLAAGCGWVVQGLMQSPGRVPGGGGVPDSSGAPGSPGYRGRSRRWAPAQLNVP